MNKKYEKILRITSEVIRQEVVNKNLSWKITEVAQICQVSRSYIYGLLGQSKELILKNSLQILIEEIYGISQERRALEKNTEIDYAQVFLKSRSLVIDCPELLSFYFRQRAKTGDLSEIIQRNEKKYLQSVGKRFNLQGEKLLFIRTIIHGISVAPYLSNEEALICLKQLMEFFELTNHKKGFLKLDESIAVSPLED